MLIQLMLSLRLQVGNEVGQLLHQIIAEDVNVEFLVGWVTLCQDWRYGFA